MNDIIVTLIALAILCSQGAGTTKEPASESQHATPDPGFAGSELLPGSKWPLLEMRDYVSTRSELVPGLKRLVAAVIEMDTDECVLPSIPHLPQRKVVDGEPLETARTSCMEFGILNSSI